MAIEAEKAVKGAYMKVSRPRIVRPKRVQTLMAAVLSVVAASATPARAQDPPPPVCLLDSTPVSIEVIPPGGFTLSGSTCDSTNSAHSYSSDRYPKGECRVPKVDYFGKDEAYKVWLHPGNNVSFKLHVTPDDEDPNPNPNPDLVLALVKCKLAGQVPNDTCVNSSIDFIGHERDEEIPARPYISDEIQPPQGIYYLYIDSVGRRDSPDRCGSYVLTVEGDNPTPDLGLVLTSFPRPAVPGTDLTYTLTVTNSGTLPATDIRAVLTLPPGISQIRPGEGCAVSGEREVRCRVDRLAAGPPTQWSVAVHVDPGTRGVREDGTNKLKSSAEVEASEGEPDFGDNKGKDDATVIGKSNLSVTLLASPPRRVIAGETLTYTFRAHNAGPSTAMNVVMTVDLPDGIDSGTVSVSGPGCGPPGRTIECKIPRLAVRRGAKVSIVGKVKPSAKHGSVLETKGSVTATEEEPEPVPNPDMEPRSKIIFPDVIRKTDLVITKTGPGNTFAGEEATYTINVCNCGPSESSGATITDTLPNGVFFRSSTGCKSNDAKNEVTCQINDAIAPADCAGGGSCNGGPASTSRTFVVEFVSSMKAEMVENTASVKANESDPAVESLPLRTEVAISADLGLEVKALNVSDLSPAQPVIAGGNLVYEVTVQNNGPSDARAGGFVEDTLQGFTFVASTDGCYGDGSSVICPIPVLKAKERISRRFVVKVDSSLRGNLNNNGVCISGNALSHDMQRDNNCDDASPVRVERQADLAVSLSDSQDPLEASGPPGSLLTYLLHVTNNGPSDADSFTASLTLPSGAQFTDTATCSGTVPPAAPPVVQCNFSNLLAGSPPALAEVDIQISGNPGSIHASAFVGPEVCPATDPECKNNQDEETTTLAAPGDADLILTKTAGTEAAVAGNLLRYTLAVTNRGFASAEDVRVIDNLPPGVMFDPHLSAPGCTAQRGTVRCDLDPFPPPAPPPDIPRLLDIFVRVNHDFTDPLVNTATVSSDPNNDPNLGNNEGTVKTPVLRVAALVLPFFKAAVGAIQPNTLLAVRNPSSGEIAVRLDYLFADQSGPVCKVECVDGKGTLTKNLSKFFSDAGIAGLKQGYVGITPVSGGCPQSCDSTIPLQPPLKPPLSGDFIRFEPPPGHASGQPLVSTDTSRVPPELCRNWSVRFFNGGSFEGSTEFLFFVPGNTGPDQALVAKGKVFEETTGKFVQEVSVTASGESFRRTTQGLTAEERFDNGVPLLASLGAIEWEFPNGVGNVSAILRNKDGFAVAVPGFCRDGNRSTASPLLVPYFEVDPAGKTTLFAVRNESDKAVNVHYEYFSDQGDPSLTGPVFILAAHAADTINLLRFADPPIGLTKGYIQVVAQGSPGQTPILSGDFVRIDPVTGLASGGPLVDTDPGRLPRQLCRSWSTRFLQGAPADSTTDFVFHISTDNPNPETITGTVYDETGMQVGTVQAPATQSSPTAFQVLASRLFLVAPLTALPENGSIEWDLGKDANGKDIVGNVASILMRSTTEKSSVLVPGVCLDSP